MLAVTLTLGLQRYVGGETLYAASLEATRAAAHEAILHNTPAAGETWQTMGLNSTNTRIGVVYLAEAVRRTLGLSVAKSYFLIETAALLAALLALFYFLRRVVGEQLAVVGLLFFSAIQPLAYAFHHFHPWDRPSLLAWICLTWLIRENKPAWVGALLPLGVVIKWDIMILPLLYLLAFARKENLRRVAATTAALGACGVVTYLALKWFLPSDSSSDLANRLGASAVQIATNVEAIRGAGVFYPPLLGLSVPIVLAAMGYRRGTRFERASCAFGVTLLLPLFLLTNFVEIRAQMPVVVLVLPLALRGLELLVVRNEGEPEFATGT
jgi:hypothetical protein